MLGTKGCCANFIATKCTFFAEEFFPLCVPQSQMSFLSPEYPLKYRRSTGDIANGVLIGPSPFGDSFVPQMPPKPPLNLHPSAPGHLPNL